MFTYAYFWASLKVSILWGIIRKVVIDSLFLCGARNLKKKDYRFDWEKTHNEWKNEETRTLYFLALHTRVINAQHDVMQELLDADPELMKKFVSRWREIDLDGFILAQDPEYNVWLDEKEEKIGDDEDPIILSRKRKPKEDIIKP